MSNILIDFIGQGNTLQTALSTCYNKRSPCCPSRYDFETFTADFAKLLESNGFRNGTLSLRCGQLDLLRLSGSQWREICAIAAKALSNTQGIKGTILQCGIKRTASLCRRIRSFYLDVAFRAMQCPDMRDSATTLFRKGRILAWDLQTYSAEQFADQFLNIQRSLECAYKTHRATKHEKVHFTFTAYGWQTKEELEQLCTIIEEYDLKGSEESVASFVASVPDCNKRKSLLDLAQTLLFPYADKENQQLIRLAHMLKFLNLNSNEVEILRISCSQRPYRTLAALLGTLRKCKHDADANNWRGRNWETAFELIPLLRLLPSSKMQYDLIQELSEMGLSPEKLRVFAVIMIPQVKKYGPTPHLTAFITLKKEQLPTFYEFLAPLFKLCPTLRSAREILSTYKKLPQEEWRAVYSVLKSAFKQNPDIAPDNLKFLLSALTQEENSLAAHEIESLQQILLTSHTSDVDHIYTSIQKIPRGQRCEVLKQTLALLASYELSDSPAKLLKPVFAMLSAHGNCECDLMLEAAFFLRRSESTSMAAKLLEYLLNEKLSLADLRVVKGFVESIQFPASSLAQLDLKILELFTSICDLDKRVRALASLRLFQPFLTDEADWKIAITYAIKAGEKGDFSLFERVYMVIDACKWQKELSLKSIFCLVADEYEQSSDEAFATLIASATPFLKVAQYDNEIMPLIKLSPYLSSYSLSLNEEAIKTLRNRDFDAFFSALFREDEEYIACGRILLADLESDDCDKIDNALRFIKLFPFFVADLTPPLRKKIEERAFIGAFKRHPLKTIELLQTGRASKKSVEDLKKAFLSYYPGKEGEQLWKHIASHSKKGNVLNPLHFLFDKLEPLRLTWKDQEVSWHTYVDKKLQLYQPPSAISCRMS